MAYDGKLLARAREQLDMIRAANQAEQSRRLALVCARIPEIEHINERLRSHMTELVRLTISRRDDIKERLAELERENLDLQIRRSELLVERGFDYGYLDEIHSCKKCRDSGVLDGRPCECLIKLYNKELTKSLGTLMKHGDESFENFDLSLYSSEYDNASGSIPREVMGLTYNSCKKFAEKFPDVSTNLLLQGEPGLGKTYLSACIARLVAGKGYSVCYDSASTALEAFERQKFSRDAAEAEAAATRVRRMLSCDLMILDDLGTEMITPMSLSALYTLINTRLTSGKATIISTNFSNDALQKHYTPQIFSRISGEYLRLPFAGRDIRLLKKGL